MWAKLLFLRDYGESEVGGFGISADDDYLLIEDIQLIKQSCSPTFVSFDDVAVADFFDQQVDTGRSPDQFARIWVHTHPGDCPEPSPTDERTFERVFGNCDWAVMFILARGGRAYARLRFNHGPTCDIEISVEIDYSKSFAASDYGLWSNEYVANISARKVSPSFQRSNEDLIDSSNADDGYDDWDSVWSEYLDPCEQKEMLYD
ncbi:hypothetical protein [Rubinisphaera italica]|uniref:hypothetical protein n=1 Tax=Rubinisphaera italica TaxID=2527969 RepID=UPI0013EF2821|nr:hypothetical protein [Rubinisphaera italica]